MSIGASGGSVLQSVFTGVVGIGLAPALALLLACSGVGGTSPTDVTGTDLGSEGIADVVTNPSMETQADTPSDLPVTGCAGDTPWCASSCGSDALVGEAVCKDDKWFCPEGVLFDDCPPGTCWGAPTPGEICGESGWECHPDQTGAYQWCPDFMCPECTGFEGPVTVDGCHCWCDGSYVLCEKVPQCQADGESDLPGVSIHFLSDTCTWTLDEAAAGIEIPWMVAVADDYQGVIPLPQDAGWCAQKGPSGLIVFEKLTGNDQTYCICDTGLCMGPGDDPVTLKKGEHPGSFAWDGVNWGGPSDTGMPKGDPFPAGSYTLTVSAVGNIGSRDGASFKVQATFTVHLIDE